MTPLKTKRSQQKQKVNPRKILKDHVALMNELEEQGVQMFMPDDNLHIDRDYLTLPTHITEVTSRDLGEYLNAFTQQKAYLRTLLGYAENKVEEARRAYVDVSSAMFKELLTTKLSETAKEREVNSSPEVRPAFEEWLNCKDRVKMIEYNIYSIEEIIFMVSREVSRRTGDFNEDRRTDNVSRR